MLLQKGLTGSLVCERVGCSPASLQNWKKEYNDGKFSLDDLEEGSEEKEEEKEKETPPPKPSKPKATASTTTYQYGYSHPDTDISQEAFVKKYWNKKTVSSMMQMPATIDDVVKLINHALEYAYDELTD